MRVGRTWSRAICPSVVGATSVGGVRDPLRGLLAGWCTRASRGSEWLHYADPEVARLRRSWSGSITPIIHWRHYGDPRMAPLGRSVTRGHCSFNPRAPRVRRATVSPARPDVGSKFQSARASGEARPAQPGGDSRGRPVSIRAPRVRRARATPAPSATTPWHCFNPRAPRVRRYGRRRRSARARPCSFNPRASGEARATKSSTPSTG